jgi:hypothetical protein
VISGFRRGVNDVTQRRLVVKDASGQPVPEERRSQGVGRLARCCRNCRCVFCTVPPLLSDFDET